MIHITYPHMYKQETIKNICVVWFIKYNINGNGNYSRSSTNDNNFK
jgi:hypothetical protein